MSSPTADRAPQAGRPDLLEVRGLCVDFDGRDGRFHAVRSVDLRVRRGETVCIVGESGCGKSVTSLAIIGLLPNGAFRTADAIRFDGRDLLDTDAAGLRALRGDRIGMVFQNPMTSLNPTMPIGRQLTEALHRHRRVNRRDAIAQAQRMLERVGIAGAASRMTQYPHQLSGGQRQRVMIAMALMCRPDLIIADEPTTALDVTIQAQILALLAELRLELDGAMVMITHDLGVVARVADRVVVMYAGEVVEEAGVVELFRRPRHPYTQALLAALPVMGVTPRRTLLGSIPGSVPQIVGASTGCAFRDRCRHALPECSRGTVALRTVGPDHRSRCILPAGPGDTAEHASA